MAYAHFKVPHITNEPIKSYLSNSPEIKSLLSKYKEMYDQESCLQASPTPKFLIIQAQTW